MGAVDDEPGGLAQDLDPRGPLQGREPPGDGLGPDLDPAFAQGVEAGEGDGGVVALMLAKHRQLDLAPVPRPGPDGDPAGGRAGEGLRRGDVVVGEVDVELAEAGPAGAGGPVDRLAGLVAPDAADDGPARA